MFDLTMSKKEKDNQSFRVPPSQYLSVGPRIDKLPRLRAQQQSTPYQAPQPELNPIVGENLFLTNTFPIRQNDNPFLKGLKGIGNFGISTLSAPGELLRKSAIQGGNLLSGNGLQELPKNTSFTQDILPQGASNALNKFSEKNPLLGGLSSMALEIAADPTSYITGNTFKTLLTPKSELGMAKLSPMTKSSAPSQEWTPPGQVRPVQRSTELGPLQLNRNNFRAKQAELTNTFNNAPVGAVDTPMTRNTLQGNIDSRLGISKPIESYQGLDAFGKPLKSYNLKETIKPNQITKTKEITIPFRKNTEKALKFTTDEFAQSIEPKGDYINYHDPSLGTNLPNYEYGNITFKNPLVVEYVSTGHGGWKTKLSEKYGGKKGKALTNAVKKDGYDGIITMDKGKEVREIVSIDGKKSNIGFPSSGKTEGEFLNALSSDGAKKTLSGPQFKLKPRELTPKPEPLPIQPAQRMVLSGNLPVDAPGRPIRQLTPITREPLPIVANEAIPAPIGEGRIAPAITSNAVTPLPEPTSKIIIGKPKEKMSFKNAWNKFYTGVVNTQQPIYNTAKAAESDMGKLASNTKNVSGIVDHNFLKNMVDKNGNKVGESLKSTVEAIPKGKEKDFWTYMTQRHNIDRAREGKSVQANYTPEMSADAVKITEQANPEYKAVGDGITKWIDDFMTTWGVDTGIVNKDIYAGLRETYPSYFPTQRDFSTLEKSIPDGLASKFADQRTPIRKATGSSRDIIDPIENIMNLVSKVVRTAKYNEVGQSLLSAVKSSPEKMKQFAEVVPVKDGMFANTDNVVSVLVDGKAQYLRINNKMLLDSMNGLPKAIGRIPVLDTLTSGFKGLITQKNPFFALRNIFRDVPTAYVYGSEANPVKFGAGLIGAGKDILTNSARLQKYQAVGGGGANFFSSGDVTKSASELMGKGSLLKKIVAKPIKAIEKFNNLTETAPRLAEFNRVLAKTGDTTKALFAANDVTVNFSRGGNITKGADKGVPYLNAGVQGLDKFFRGFLNPKVALATIVKSGVAITAPDLALYMVNKDNPNYQALDNRTKDTYFLIPQSDGTFIKIPKSRELGVLFGSLLERGLRAAEGQEDSFKGFGNAVKTSFAPTNPFDSNFISPFYNVFKTNKDFANRAIVPQSMIMDKRSKYLQYDDRTTSVAKSIGELTTNIPGLPGGLSPKQLDYLVKSYSGVIGQFGTPLLVPGGSPSKALTSQFISDPKFSSQDTTDFYDKLDKLSAAATDKNIINKIPSKTLTPEENMRNSMNGVSTALSRGTKLINKVQASNDISKDAQIKAIKTQMLDLTSKAVSANDPKSMQRVEDGSKKMFLK